MPERRAAPEPGERQPRDAPGAAAEPRTAGRGVGAGYRPKLSVPEKFSAVLKYLFSRAQRSGRCR